MCKIFEPDYENFDKDKKVRVKAAVSQRYVSLIYINIIEFRFHSNFKHHFNVALGLSDGDIETAKLWNLFVHFEDSIKRFEKQRWCAGCFEAQYLTTLHRDVEIVSADSKSVPLGWM